MPVMGIGSEQSKESYIKELTEKVNSAENEIIILDEENSFLHEEINNQAMKENYIIDFLSIIFFSFCFILNYVFIEFYNKKKKIGFALTALLCSVYFYLYDFDNEPYYEIGHIYEYNNSMFNKQQEYKEIVLNTESMYFSEVQYFTDYKYFFNLCKEKMDRENEIIYCNKENFLYNNSIAIIKGINRELYCKEGNSSVRWFNEYTYDKLKRKLKLLKLNK